MRSLSRLRRPAHGGYPVDAAAVELEAQRRADARALLKLAAFGWREPGRVRDELAPITLSNGSQVGVNL